MTSLRGHLADFIAANADLARVYALAIVLGDEGNSATFAAVDEPSIEAKLAAQYPDVRPPWEDQFWGTRWNPGDFPHMQTIECDAELEAAIDALERAEFSFDTTADFVAFVARFDQSEDERKAWMRRTIEPATFDRLFPELVAFERFLEDASTLPPAEQAAFWASAMEELTLKSATPRANKLAELGRTQYDASDALVALGEAAVEPLLEIVERHAFHPPFNKPDSLAFQLHGALSAESKLTTSAMFALQEIGVRHPTIDRLGEVLHALVDAYPETGTVGVSAAVAARVLHSLAPDTYPKADVDPGNNRLLNRDAY